jgi:tetrahydromethanopterin S-methyltransferase subunit H
MKQQTVYELRNVKIGGSGENATVLVPSIFYDGHMIVEDDKKGIFDKKAASELIEKTENLSQFTGSPVIYDIVASHESAIVKYIEFVSERTENFFLIDSSSKEVRLRGVKYVEETGLSERAIYNSIDYNSSANEIEALKNSKVKFVVLMAYNPTNPFPNGKIETLSRLLKSIDGTGMKPLVDTAVLDAPSIGLAAEAIKLVKENFALPAGCAPSNGVFTCKSFKKFGEARHSINSAVCAYLATCGADFILFGPIEEAEYVFPAVAAVDGMRGYAARTRGTKIEKEHPLYRVF